MSESAATTTSVGTMSCCGNPPQSQLASPEPATEAGAPCCGTGAEARREGSCCGAAAKQNAVAAGQGCCG
ncbi:hypothetical protein BJY16_005652 [Actinoplanes octamycinicus]|uniref:Uncharacterized protein n=1 Tax=Actinoplanes octamycinicus TaxID=135948 RepID=A0A7W7H1J2_9ACTN|nr:hypothetical protein [Actinoplanes octamycinicus]MBB4742193.1 hypothetical protein [Actinoplanes octamycinicus]GIE59961.1 hypothetical protein Aoc01nite_53630 [Actinoplanes octamycinicus]